MNQDTMERGKYKKASSAFLVAVMVQLLEGDDQALIWTVGDEWITYECGKWTIGPDMPATIEEVEALVLRLGEDPVQWIEQSSV